MDSWQDIFREARKKAGVTRESMAKELELSSAAIGQYERGERTPTLATFTKMCNLLKVDPGEVLGMSTPFNRACNFLGELGIVARALPDGTVSVSDPERLPLFVELPDGQVIERARLMRDFFLADAAAAKGFTYRYATREQFVNAVERMRRAFVREYSRMLYAFMAGQFIADAQASADARERAAREKK